MLFDRPHYVFSDTIILLSDTILLIEARIFDISIDSFSLNMFFIFMTTLAVSNRKTFFFSIWYFSFFRFSIFTSNIAIHLSLFRFYWKCFNIILSFFLYSWGENKLVYSNKLLPFDMKFINPIQKYPHIIESYSCILKTIILVILLFPMNFLISFGMCLTPKLSKYVIFLAFTYKAMQWVPIDSYLSRSITYAPSFILGKLFLEWAPLT